MSEEKKGFVVKDRRFFTEADAGQEAKAPPAESPPEQPPQEAAPEAKKEAPTGKAETEAPLPEINFATFIMSLNASALVHLGVIEDPATGQKVKNLALGKQTIDLMGMLKEKTAGNLTTEEEKMLKDILYDLRIMYVREKG
jgi:hypothetical protein